MQSGAALAYGVSEQAFKRVAGIRVAGVIPVRATTISKIPIGERPLG
jgi:hypothetical protein